MRRYLGLGISAAAVIIASQGVAVAQVTTSSIRGVVEDSNGDAVGGAAVTITHTPSGSRVTTTTSASGVFNSSSLRVGGPYSIQIVAPDYQPLVLEGVNLELQQTANLDFALTPSTLTQDVIVVTAGREDVRSLSSGASTVFGQDEIASTSGASRDPKEIIRLDPRAAVLDGADLELSIAGINQRFNSLTVNGIRLNDDFGLNRSGNPGRANPVSIDAIEQIVVNTTEYDVEASQFIGGNINIITKSGTNEFHGSAYSFFRNSQTSGDLPDGTETDFDDFTYGFTLGGPIIKDRLFFFANYERFENETPVNVLPGDLGIADAEIDAFVTALDGTFGFDRAGEVLNSLPTTDERILIKIDANITDDHRANFTYTRDDASTIFEQGAPFLGTFDGAFYLSTANREQDNVVDAYSGQLFSNWTDNFSSELSYSFKDAFTDRNPTNEDFGQVGVLTAGGAAIFAGQFFPDQQNFQSNKFQNFKAIGRYTLGNHTIKAGYEWQRTDILNSFVLFAPNGGFLFDSIADLENRTARAI